MSQTRNTLISQSSLAQSVHPSAKLAVFWLPVPPNVVSSSSPTDPTNFQREPTVSDQNSRARLLGCHTPHTALAWPTHHHHSIVGRTRRFGIPSSGSVSRSGSFLGRPGLGRLCAIGTDATAARNVHQKPACKL